MLKTLRRPARSKPKRIGPQDHGRRMTLDAFDRATGEEGYLYELNKGVIEVTDVPHPRHMAQLLELRDQLVAYKLKHPGVIYAITGSNDSKILLADDQSE